jgi:hypothetical protein
MSTTFTPLSPAALAARLAVLIDDRHSGRCPLRVGLDVPGTTDTSDLLAALAEELLWLGRSLVLVRTADFYRDASVRLEYGHTDVESFYSSWLDTGALQREVLDPAVAQGRYLPSLRDPASNRATRASALELPPTAVLLLIGELLLGRDLHLDLTVHVAVSRQARKRQTPPERQWTLPAFDRYDIEVDPAGQADALIRWDDPRHPALRNR